MDADVLIIGAGAAGLAAAAELAGHGRQVLLIEARSRIGGRLWTQHVEHWPIAVELGAEFVHGSPESTWGVIRRAQALAVELPEDNYRATGQRIARLRDFWGVVDAVGKRITPTGADRSVADHLARSRLAPMVRRTYRAFVEGYHAADLERASVRALSTRGEPFSDQDRVQYRLPRGYDAVIDGLLAALPPDRSTLRLSMPVTRVTWRAGRVEVEAGAERFTAKKAIVTVPVGVLRAGSIAFEPALSEKRAALDHFGMSSVAKVVLRFSEAFWEERLSTFGFLHSDGEFLTWWSARPAVVPMLTAWAGGRAARELLAAGRVVERAVDAAATLFGVPRKRARAALIEGHHHDWDGDPHARGAYSYVLVGGARATRGLRSPLADTLYFAGEATADESGTVGGAIESGRRAAREAM